MFLLYTVLTGVSINLLSLFLLILIRSGVISNFFILIWVYAQLNEQISLFLREHNILWLFPVGYANYYAIDLQMCLILLLCLVWLLIITFLLIQLKNYALRSIAG